MKYLIVNAITCLRFIGIVLIIISFYCFSGFVTSIIALICFFSDFLDGFLARKLKCSTFFGSIIDTLADKLFILVSLILIINTTKVSITIIIIELLILIVQFIKYLKKVKVYSNCFGKLKMWIVGCTLIIVFYLSDYNISDITYFYLFIPLIVVETINLVSYIFYDRESNNNLSKKDRNKFAKITFKEFLFSHEIYEEYKNTSSLKTLYNIVKNN